MKPKISFFCIILLLLAAQSKSQDTNFKFAWITDTHIGYASASKDLLSIIEEINNNSEISFVILSGDITEKGKSKELVEAKSILEKLKIKYFVIPGNHDYKWSETGTLEFFNQFYDDKFAFRYNGFLFIGMNSAVPLRGGLGHFASHDVIWLDTFLNSLRDEKIPIIFFTHFPVDKYNIDNYFSILNLLSKRNVQFIGVGHGHANNELRFDGIKGIMVKEAFGKNSNPTYAIVEVNQDSILFNLKNVNKNDFIWHASLKREYFPKNDLELKNANEWKYFDSKKFSVLWSDSVKYLTLSNPVFYENKVLVCDMLGRINCYEIDNGEKLWEYQLDNSIASTPKISKGRALISSVDGRVYLFNINDGKIIWQNKFPYSIISTPIIDGDTAYFGTSKYSFISIGLNSGSELWEFKEIKAHIESSPVIYKNMIFFTSWDGYLYALNKTTGELVWKWIEKIPNFYYSPAAVTPIVMNDRVILTAPNKYLTIIDVLNGNTLWRSNLHPSWESIGCSYKDNKIFVKGITDTLFCYIFKNDSLSLEWYNVLGYGFDISPIPIQEKNGNVYVPSSNGFLYCVDSKTGNYKWQYFVGEAMLNNPIILDDDSIIIGNIDGIIKRIRYK